jgi:hydroxymethylpyrimidine/phosphomethylpyrimidine kinase
MASRAPSSSEHVVALAGHDSSGRAGLDADREAARAFGLELTAVVTAWTEQDTGGVRAVRPRPAGEWLAELERALEGAVALKTGLLPGAEHVRALARFLAGRDGDLPIVVDPVLGASTGEAFLDAAGLAALREELLALPLVLTPNVPEAARLAGLPPGELAGDPDRRLEAAERLLERGLAGLVLKGGHGAEDPVRDLVWARGGEPSWHEHARVPGAGLRGSGCRHATALACGLARGLDLAAAAGAAGEHLARLLAERAQD